MSSGEKRPPPPPDSVQSRKEMKIVASPTAKAVVMIAYYFPPDGSAGVYRPLRFVRQLPTRGWQPSVVTLDTDTHQRPDPGLLKLVPPDVEIVRVRDGDLWGRIQARREDRTRAQLRNADAATVARVRRIEQIPARRIVRRFVRALEGHVYYPDPARFWIEPAIAATVATCRSKRAAAILATGGPWSSFVVAREASRRTGVPYVLDFRDSWTLTRNEDFEQWRPQWATRRDRRLLPELLAAARAIIFRYESEAESYWRAYPHALDAARVHLIPNGYEGDVKPFRAPRGDRCTVLYTGTLTSYRYDTLLDALSTLRALYPADAARLGLTFVGEGGQDLQDDVDRRGLADMVQTRGPVPAHEVDRLHDEAHALLLLGVRPFRGYELGGSKVFAYLKSAKPIIGILPNDETRNVLRAVHVPTIAGIDDPGEIVAVFRQLLCAWSQDRLGELLPDRAACASYSAGRQVDSFVRAIEGRPPQTPFIPGRVDIPDSLKSSIGRSGWID